MFRIGEFARLTRVSIRMLRHYDEIGLLKPEYIDPQTGFRYYSLEQLPRLNRLIALKDLGFSLEQIAILLDAGLSNEQVKGMFRQKRKEIERRVAEEQQRLAGIEWRLEQMEQETALPAGEVVLRPATAQLVAALTVNLEGEGEPDLPVSLGFDNLERFAARHRAREVAPPLTLYNQSGSEAEPRGLELAIPLSHAVPGEPPIRVYELPGCDMMACLVHTGTYELLGVALGSLLRWIEANHFQIDGPLREVYLRFSAGEQDYNLPPAYLTGQPHLFVTELQLPVKA